MNDYKLEFKLKQHTPIIHFQAEQKGATLRASELKPKLDRFLITKLGDGDYEAGKKVVKKKDWLIGKGEHFALDYKVRIDSKDYKYEAVTHMVSTRSGNKPNNFPCFFAEMGEESKKYYFAHDDEIYISIQTFNENILNNIEDKFQEFIFIHTFGTRQSKGFGSFTLTHINNKAIESQTYGTYKFTIDLNKYQDRQLNPFRYFNYLQDPTSYYLEKIQLFDVINRFHQVLRSGINESFYIKPFIFSYAKSQNVTWDKKTFKQKFLAPEIIEEQITEHEIEDDEPLVYEGVIKNVLVRDCLGLSTEQKWGDYKFKVRHPKNKDKPSEQDKYPNNYKDKEKRGKSIPPNDIVRIKSPITYKPIKIKKGVYDVYLILNPLDEILFDNSTTFRILKDRNGVQNELENMNLWSGFNLNDFMIHVFNNKNNLESLLSRKKSDKDTAIEDKKYKLIKNIYTSLMEVK